MSEYIGGADLLEALGVKPGQEVLVVHAHPDDETILTGHTIAGLSRNGVDVHAVIATDGEASTLGDSALVRYGYRRLEAAQALETLGVDPDRQHYLGLEDGALGQPINKERLVAGIGRILLDHGFAAVFTAGEKGIDGHPDHVAAHHAAILAIKNCAEQPQVWGLTSSNGEVTVAPDAGLKLAAAAKHRTQYPDVQTEITEGILTPYANMIFNGEHYNKEN